MINCGNVDSKLLDVALDDPAAATVAADDVIAAANDDDVMVHEA